jgi:hypothetical protein
VQGQARSPSLILNVVILEPALDFDEIDRGVAASAPAIMEGLISQAKAGDLKACELFLKYGLVPLREAAKKKCRPEPIPPSIRAAIALVEGLPEDAVAPAQPTEPSQATLHRRAGAARARAALAAKRAAHSPTLRLLAPPPEAGDSG